MEVMEETGKMEKMGEMDKMVVMGIQVLYKEDKKLKLKRDYLHLKYRFSILDVGVVGEKEAMEEKVEFEVKLEKKENTKYE